MNGCIMVNRKQKALKNIIIAFFSNILIYLLSLFTSKIIKEKLGLDILGLNGVLTNIISILSLTELGVGSAITFALYEPLVHNNKELIKSIMAFYKRTYRIIALLVAVIGLLLLPVIPLFIKGSLFSKKYLFIVYLLFLMNSVLSYLLIYKRTLIVADQRNYIVTTVTLFYTYALKIFQLVAVYFTSNYILFLLIQIICTLIYNLIISFICDKLYPFLKAPSKKLDQEYYQIIIKKIKALFFHSIGSVIVLGTDNILISYFCGITEAGRYTTYLSIINMIGTIIILVFDNLRDTLGNFLVTETKERKRHLFHNLVFMNQTLVSIFSICLVLLLTPFIQIWFGQDTVLPNYIVIIMIFCFYIQKNMLCVGSMKTAAGLFEQDKFVPIYESCVNLVASILLAKKFGIVGIVLGTIISTLSGPFLFQAIIVFKNIFNENPIKYFITFGTYFFRFVFVLLITKYFFNHVIKFVPTNILNFFVEAVFIFIFVSILWFFTVFWKQEFKYILRIIQNKFSKK